MNDYRKRSIHLREQIKAWLESFDRHRVIAAAKYFESNFHIDTEKVIVDLSKQGWFIWLAEGSLEDSFSRVHDFLGKPPGEQSEIAIRLISEETHNIKSELISCYADRKNIISDAFSAHEHDLYGASIPTFLALAEGICREHHPDIGLYAKDRKTKKPKTLEIIKNTPHLDIFEEVILKPLITSTATTESINNPNQSDHFAFNRHLIMHGKSKNYATRINSLKGIALLDYTHKSLSHIKNR